MRDRWGEWEIEGSKSFCDGFDNVGNSHTLDCDFGTVTLSGPQKVWSYEIKLNEGPVITAHFASEIQAKEELKILIHKLTKKS